MPKVPVAQRFWNKVERTETCWLWTGARNTAGYGHIGVDGVPRSAHRVAYELQIGPIPKGMDVCHHCDVRNCVRGDHLYAGTTRQNMQDRSRRGRWAGPVGEAHPRAKLTAKQVRRIRARYKAGGISQAALASEYGVNQTMIGFIVRGHSWKSV